MRLAASKLSDMAAGAGLRLSFSTERSVEDELARESTSGACWLVVCLLGRGRVQVLSAHHHQCCCMHGCRCHAWSM